MAGSKMFHEAMTAIQNGERDRARDLLTRLLRTEKNNAEYWLWMSSLVDTPRERIYCLQSVIKLDPENAAAQQGLILLGATAPDDALTSSLPVRRKWEVEIDEGEEPTGIQRVFANPIVRLVSILSAVVILIGLIIGAILGTRGTLFASRSSITPIVWTDTPTHTVTPSPIALTPTPSPETVVPLWMLLEATYTPTPLYVNTPHPRIEAYRAGIRAYERGDYDLMLNFMQQAAREESESPDTHYYLGEAYRITEQYDLAIEAYTQAIEVDPTFAPAYLARAKVHMELGVTTDVIEDIDKAVEYDPNFGEAFLVRAAHLLSDGKYEAAQEDLDAVQTVLVDNPQYYMLRAEIDLALGEIDSALSNAEAAYERDITILELYLLLAKIQLLNNDPESALENIQIYGRYEEDDPQYWVLLAWALYAVGDDLDAAQEAVDTALELSEDNGDAYLVSGWIAMSLGESKDALNDFYLAKNLLPRSFDANFGFGQALFAEERNSEAVTQFDLCEDLAVTDKQFASVYYYRANAFLALSQFTSAANNYQSLIELPMIAVPVDWRLEARAYLATATPTLTPSNTLTPTATPTNTATFTVTPSPTITPSFTATPSPTITTSPTTTGTPSATTTPSVTPTASITPTP